ncbi:class I SAM-dependent methyltransferase [Leekyejoonella antrihumi]|uniref:Class I SAM-dependent methyltransferase n=1 Tax=Leekyejoonella antrihumi TaxID=1660198 RepID=A0A563E932_9MICO|nr:class I SAM-dependent methyltransferase [Leekyejoonella antrihumi]TWP38314.1 class I SAM-dependent methyltransferase [Leekyejoonella antrihumi]
MVDAIFGDPRLAALYDVFDGARDDLDPYAAIVSELGAASVLDLGCGTGSFALLLAERGVEVTGIDPAGASLDVARGKPGAERVNWVQCDHSCLPTVQVDVAVMTGNVAQVFLTDDAWSATLTSLRGVLRVGGHLVFETRRPDFRAWERWQNDSDEATMQIPGTGTVAHRRTVTRVDLPLVSFQHSYTFPDRSEVSSESTLRFRSREEIDASLTDAGFVTVDVRQAPDRPGAEYVFLAQRRQ